MSKKPEGGGHSLVDHGRQASLAGREVTCGGERGRGGEKDKKQNIGRSHKNFK